MIEIKTYEKKYEKDLLPIISKTWNYGEICSEKTCLLLAKSYLNSCLACQTFNYVVVEDGVCKGIIVGKSHKSNFNFKYKFRVFTCALKLMFNKESKKITNIFSTVSNVDKDLLKKANKSYEAEVCYFVVDESLRGQGIGKKLLNLFKEQINKDHCVNYYLFTDSSCNYNFYLHNGLKIAAKEDRKVDLCGYKADLELFILDQDLSD